MTIGNLEVLFFLLSKIEQVENFSQHRVLLKSQILTISYL